MKIILILLLVLVLATLGCTQLSAVGTVTNIEHYLRDIPWDADKVYLKVTFDSGIVIELEAGTYYGHVFRKKIPRLTIGKKYYIVVLNGQVRHLRELSVSKVVE